MSGRARSNSLFVFTGGPGAGKSSVIAELARRGFATQPEAGRAIIREQLATGGQALPWTDRHAYGQAMLAADILSYKDAAATSGPVFFDRGVPDTLGYLRLCGLPVPENLAQAVKQLRYNRKVFAFPYWPDIYANDAERKQSPAEAEATYAAVTGVYVELGYEIVRMPLASVAERADVVINLASGGASA